MHEQTSNYTIKNVNKALELLEKLAESPQEATLPVLADSIGFSRNKTFRILATLIEKGLVNRDSATGGYKLSPRTLALGRKLVDTSNVSRTKKSPAHVSPVGRNIPVQQGPDGSDLVRFAHPILEDLARKHDEAVYMTVIKDNEVLFLNMVDSVHPIKTAPLIGKKFPFFTNAAGKVMMAVDSWDLLERICRRQWRAKKRDLQKLETELQEIKVTGVAVDHGGLGEGIISVAVAVRDYAGKIIGAITILGPSFRMLASRIESEIIPSMVEGAYLVSEKFGYARA